MRLGLSIILIFTHKIRKYYLQTLWHDVAGTVQIVDDKTLVIRNFVYDGEGPDAFFTVGVRSRKPNPNDATPIRLPLHINQ